MIILQLYLGQLYLWTVHVITEQLLQRDGNENEFRAYGINMKFLFASNTPGIALPILPGNSDQLFKAQSEQGKTAEKSHMKNSGARVTVASACLTQKRLIDLR